jgi:hypothetical protein
MSAVARVQAVVDVQGSVWSLGSCELIIHLDNAHGDRTLEVSFSSTHVSLPNLQVAKT